jgi:VCBS repeat-containing protein
MRLSRAPSTGEGMDMTSRRRAARLLASIATAGVLVGSGMLAATAPVGANPTPTPTLNALPLLTPVAHHPSASTTTGLRFGEAGGAVNPTNPSNIIATYNQDPYTQNCVATEPNNCTLVTATLQTAFGPFVVQEPTGDFASLGGPPQFATCGVFTSFDHGTTWTHVAIPGWPAGMPWLKDQGDCHVSAGPNGTFYVSFDDLDWNSPSNALPACAIGVDKSTDGGLTWTGASVSGTGCDGPKIASDPNDGRTYSSASGALGSNSTGNPAAPLVPFTGDRYLTSTSDGVNWTAPEGFGGLDTSVSPAVYRTASGFMSAANGTLAAAFRSTTAGSCTFFVRTGSPCLVFQYTTNAGLTWVRHSVDGAASVITGNVMVAADPSTPGHYTVAGTNASNAFVSYQTTNYGATWSAGATVADPNAFNKYHAWIDYASTGVLGMMWKARTTSNLANTPFNVYAAISMDGGATWGTGAINVGNSAAASTSTSFSAVSDDYSNITMGPDVAYINFARWPSPTGDRTGEQAALRFLDYTFNGLLPPLDGSNPTVHGASVPVQFQLSVKGENVYWASATLNIDGHAATSNVPGQGNSFRYDPTTQEYIFNASTKGLSAGTHTFTVNLDDGTSHTLTVTVK